MKVYLLFPLLATITASAQPYFTWKNGPSVIEIQGTYGNVSVPAQGNQPGARENALSITSSDGTLWLFGGKGLSTTTQQGYLNDLWSYAPANNEWTWESGDNSNGNPGNYLSMGSPTATGKPSARQNACGWYGNDQCLYLFGGQRSTNNHLNDLWKYNPATNQWTWLSGSSATNNSGNYGTIGVSNTSNTPPSRYGAVYWTDNSGNFWLFGGQTYSGGSAHRLNDLWKYDPASNQWTWMSGSNLFDQNGSYGTENVANSSNVPGARQAGVGWVDDQNCLWLFGGDGYPASGAMAYMNDVWKYAVSTGNWTWIAGSNGGSTVAEYGTLGTGSATTHPGARQMAIAWKENSGKFLLLGGWGHVAINQFGRLNDLWEFDPATEIWTWIAGGNTPDLPAQYGTLGQASDSTITGGRRMACSWTTNDTCWFFGGSGYDSLDSLGILSDLWYITQGTSGIQEQEAQLSIYPNPSNGTFMLLSDMELTENQLFVYTMDGKEITEYTLSQDHQLQLSHPSPGTYFLKYKTAFYRFVVN